MAVSKNTRETMLRFVRPCLNLQELEPEISDEVPRVRGAARRQSAAQPGPGPGACGEPRACAGAYCRASNKCPHEGSYYYSFYI